MNCYYCLFTRHKKDEQLDHAHKAGHVWSWGPHPQPCAGGWAPSCPALLPCGCHAELDSHRPDPLPPITRSPQGLAKPGQRTKDSFSHSQPGNLGAIWKRSQPVLSHPPAWNSPSLTTICWRDVSGCACNNRTVCFQSMIAVPFKVTVRLLHILHSV